MAIVFPPVNSGGASAASLSSVQGDITIIDSIVDAIQADVGNPSASGTDLFATLKYLYNTADATLASIIDDSILAHILAKDGDVSDFDDTTDSLEALSESIAGLGGEHVKLFTGTVYYVDATRPDNTGTGLTPTTAKKTITAAITAATAGDGIAIKAGTYGEDVDLNKTGLEMWPELGTIINGQSADQALLISGNYCGIQCEHGALRVNPIALKTAVKASGNWTYLTNIRANCASLATIGYDITGDGCVLQNCRANNPLTVAFKIQGDIGRFDTCCTGGETANSSIGFWLTNSCNKIRFRDCGSQGHATAGYQVDAGVSNAVFEGCYSGGGDGGKIDNGTDTVWSNYSFDDKPTKEITLDGVTTHNIFKVTGAVRVTNIYASVQTGTAATASNIHIEAYSTNGSADISDAPGSSIASLPIGALIVRNGPVTDALAIVNPTSGPVVEENASYRDPVTTIDVVRDTGADTYIRAVLSAATSGVLNWHCRYLPLSDDGFLAPA